MLFRVDKLTGQVKFKFIVTMVFLAFNGFVKQWRRSHQA
jgi:hypothetical protein